MLVRTEVHRGLNSRLLEQQELMRGVLWFLLAILLQQLSPLLKFPKIRAHFWGVPLRYNIFGLSLGHFGHYLLARKAAQAQAESRPRPKSYSWTAAFVLRASFAVAKRVTCVSTCLHEETGNQRPLHLEFSACAH